MAPCPEIRCGTIHIDQWSSFAFRTEKSSLIAGKSFQIFFKYFCHFINWHYTHYIISIAISFFKFIPAQKITSERGKRMVELSACIHGMFPLLSYQSLAEWLAWFRDVYGHEGACLDSGQVRRKYIFELYIPVCQRTEAESGFFVPALPPWLWEYYNTVKFQKLYLRTADQLFAAAFALWYGLPPHYGQGARPICLRYPPRAAVRDGL